MNILEPWWPFSKAIWNFINNAKLGNEWNQDAFLTLDGLMTLKKIEMRPYNPWKIWGWPYGPGKYWGMFMWFEKVLYDDPMTFENFVGWPYDPSKYSQMVW